MNTRRVQAAMAALTLAAVAGLTGCGSATDAPATPPNEVAAAACEQIAATQVPAATKTAALVVDRTSSMRSGDLPPAITDALGAAQQKGLSLTLIGVNGRGTHPVVLAPLPLDPMPGVVSRDADLVRSAALACVGRWIEDPRLAPTEEGSDVLAAVAAGVDQKPATILIISDGIATAGELDLAAIGWDATAKDVTARLHQAKALPKTKVPITWVGMGQSGTVLPAAARSNLVALWKAILGGALSVDTRLAGGGPAAESGLPADPVPTMVQHEAGCFRVQTGLLFAFDSAKVLDAQPLSPVVEELKTHPDWFVLVLGHTDAQGSAAYNLKLSNRRAAAVATALREAGIPESVVIKATGKGEGVPLELDLNSARNRRVEIAYGPAADGLGGMCTTR